MKESTMNEAVEAVEVTQADRDLADAMWKLSINWGSDAQMAELAARHRIASVAAARPFHMEEAAGIVRKKLAMVVLQNAESANLQWIEAVNFASDRAQEAIRAAKTDGAAHD